MYCLIQLMDGRLCSGSGDKTIKVWNKNAGICELSIDIDFSKGGRYCTTKKLSYM